MRKTYIILLCTLTSAIALKAQNIGWVSFHPGDDTPSGGAAGAGFTMAPDVGYTDLLSGAGYNVTRFPTRDDITAADVALLNSFDLVIISRSVNSGHYQSAGETAAWNGLTTKLMDMSGWTLRNSRLGFTTGGTMVDTVGPVSLSIAQLHPIFNGIAVDGGTGGMFNNYSTDLVTYDHGSGPVTQRGISLNMDPLAGNPQVIATVGTASDPTFGGLVIGLWEPGSVMANGSADVLGGYRLVFLSGSREANGVSSETAGVLDLTDDGQQIFLNSVDYMISVVPEPSTYALMIGGGFFALWMMRRGRRA